MRKVAKGKGLVWVMEQYRVWSPEYLRLHCHQGLWPAGRLLKAVQSGWGWDPALFPVKLKILIWALCTQRKGSFFITHTKYGLEEVLLTRSLDWALERSHGTGCYLLRKKVLGEKMKKYRHPEPGGGKTGAVKSKMKKKLWSPQLVQDS